MKWLLNLPTRTKLFLGFGLMIVFLAAVVVTAYTSLAAIQESQKRIYSEDFANAVDLSLLRISQNGVRAALLTMMAVTKRSDQEAWHQDARDRAKVIDETVQRLLERNRNDSRVLRRLEELNAVRKAFSETRDTQLIPLIYAGKIEEAKGLALGIQAERYLKMRSIGMEIGEEAVERARHRLVLAGQRADNSVRILVILGLVALLIGMVVAVFLARIIAVPLRETSGFAERVASGDLTVDLPSDSRADEVGVLVQTFRKMVANLRDVTREIQEGVNVLGSSASQILAATTQVVSSGTEAATAVNQTTTTLQEVKQTSEVSSRKAQDVSERAQKVAQISQGGQKAVEASIEGMHRIREQMESVAASIMRLSEQSQAIGGIIATVNDLAEQSNLLAVNAAIEAAKAGEAGKGFAVVAQEVKSLAEQSKQATAQVRAILNDIQKATGSAVMATEQANKSVAAGVKQSTEAGGSIRMLAESIAEAAQAAVQIVASSQQQVAGMDQVALAMEQIKQVSAENLAAMKQTETSARNLRELGQKLKQVVERYKV